MSARLQYFYTWGYRSNRTSGLHPFSLPCFLVVSNSFFARGPLLLKSWVKDGSKTHTHENMSMHDCLVVMKVKRGFSCDDLAAMQNLHPSVRNAADCTRISGVECDLLDVCPITSINSHLFTHLLHAFTRANVTNCHPFTTSNDQ